MERTPYSLAALASAAVPGLDPVSVEAVPSAPDDEFDIAFVMDAQDRRWVVRAPRTPAAGARMDMAAGLLHLLARRVPFALPVPKGFVDLGADGRAAVYTYLPGRSLDLAALPEGQGVAVELGRTIAALHNVDPALFDEAGLPAYDADTYRTRRLADLDLAAATGRVPTTLLARWERALEDVNLWRFAPVPIHGDLTGDEVLVTFTDEQDASTARVKGLTGWEDAKVADPADDFAAILAEADPGALETVMEAYAHTRVERPDPHLLIRARLAAELALLGELRRALAAGFTEAADAHTAALRQLDDEVHAQAEAADDYRRTSLEPAKPRARTAPPPIDLQEEDDDDLPALDDDSRETASDDSGDGSADDAPDTSGADDVADVVAEEADRPEELPDGGSTVRGRGEATEVLAVSGRDAAVADHVGAGDEAGEATSDRTADRSDDQDDDQTADRSDDPDDDQDDDQSDDQTADQSGHQHVHPSDGSIDPAGDDPFDDDPLDDEPPEPLRPEFR